MVMSFAEHMTIKLQALDEGVSAELVAKRLGLLEEYLEYERRLDGQHAAAYRRLVERARSRGLDIPDPPESI